MQFASMVYIGCGSGGNVVSEELELCALVTIVMGIAFIAAHFAYVLLRDDCNDKDKRDM